MIFNSRDTNVAQGDNSWMCDSSLVMALFRCYGLDYSLLCVYEASYITLTFLRPTILEYALSLNIIIKGWRLKGINTQHSGQMSQNIQN